MNNAYTFSASPQDARAKKFGLGTSRKKSRSKTRKLGCGLWNETRRLIRRLGNSQPNANLEDFIRASWLEHKVSDEHGLGLVPKLSDRL